MSPSDTAIQSPSKRPPRVAIIGIWLESNRFAPVATEDDFRGYFWFEGDAILTETRGAAPIVVGEAPAFVKTMDATGPWEPVPVLLAGAHPAGPVDGTLFADMLGIVRTGLQDAGPLDAVYIANHGAMVATDRDDPDGDVFATVREVVGPDTTIVATLDLHGNISERMVESVDLIVGYRTNPHVDQVERGEEAAHALRLILAGLAKPKSAFIRLPLVPASVALLSGESAYGDMIDLGVRRRAELAGDILNTSIFGNFVFSDTPQNGVGIVVTARHDVKRAQMLATEIATYGWANRARFVKKLTPLDRAVEMALDRDRLAVIFSDSGDNPGGGGTGRTTPFLKALIAADARDVFVGSFFDPPLAQVAHKAGIGASIHARFNSHPGLPDDLPVDVSAEVVGLHDGTIIGRLGYAQGKKLVLGPSAALKIGGITVIVISDRMQTADPMFFEMFGLDIGDAHTVVVKSRGHFRAGFTPWFPTERVFEVDTPGLTSPVLERLDLKHIPRPSYPHDLDTDWSPPEW
ncbi:MAG: M81 family metallopeptidase [Pseudomonadota bacterium]